MDDYTAIKLMQQINTHAEAMARIAGMEAENAIRESEGKSLAYDEEAFDNLCNELGLHHNVRCELMQR